MVTDPPPPQQTRGIYPMLFQYRPTVNAPCLLAHNMLNILLKDGLEGSIFQSNVAYFFKRCTWL